MNDLKSLLKSLIGHKLTLTFTVHEEGELRDVQGILKDFDDEFIHLKIFDFYGEVTDYYLNRHACTLHSIVDYGLANALKVFEQKG
jgi:hypothetical protein